MNKKDFIVQYGFWAAHNGHTTTVYALLEKEGIDPLNVQSEYGNTALMLGSANSHTEIVRALLQHEAVC